MYVTLPQFFTGWLSVTTTLVKLDSKICTSAGDNLIIEELIV